MLQLMFIPLLLPFSRDGQYIIGGSEDNYIYIWKTHHDVSKLSSARRDRNEYYESFSGEPVDCATCVHSITHVHTRCGVQLMSAYRYEQECTKRFPGRMSYLTPILLATPPLLPHTSSLSASHFGNICSCTGYYCRRGSEGGWTNDCSSRLSRVH